METSHLTTSIDEAGRIPLPQLVRSRLRVKPGDKLTLTEQNGQWFLNRITTAAHPHVDDLAWEELSYASIPPIRLGELCVRIEQRGTLTPMTHNLDS